MKSRLGPNQVDMPESVRDALDALRPVPAPDSDAWARSRAAFLAEARQYAQDLPTVPIAATVPTSWWRRFHASVSNAGATLLHNGGLLTTAVKAGLVIALVLAGSVGTVSAARESLPGSPLYALKVRLETWDLDRARTPDDIARMALAQTDVRVAEATRLQDRGDPVPEETAVRYQEQLTLAVMAAQGLDEPVRERTRAEISESVGHQLRTLESTAAHVQGGDGSVNPEGADPGVRAMIETMRATQAQLGQPENTGSGVAEPSGPGDGPSLPVVDDGIDEPSVGNSDTAGNEDRPSTVPGPGGVSNGPVDHEPGDGVPDRAPSPSTGGDADDDAPGQGPVPGPQGGGQSNAPGAGAAPVSGPDGTGSDNRGGAGNSDSVNKSGQSGPNRSGRS